MSNQRTLATVNDYIPSDGYKQCFTCRKFLPSTSDYFSKVLDSLDFSPNCKQCRDSLRLNSCEVFKLMRSEVEQSGSEKRAIAAQKLKHCGMCNQDLPATTEFFHVSDTYHDGFAYYCRECISEYYKARRRLNGITVEPGGIAFYTDEERRAKQRENSRNWRRNNPEKRRILSRNYQARKRGAGGKYTFKDIDSMWGTQKGLCWWCGIQLSDQYHIDHRIPIVKGGSNSPSNLCLSCPHCNLSKSDKMPWEFNGRLL